MSTPNQINLLFMGRVDAFLGRSYIEVFYDKGFSISVLNTHPRVNVRAEKLPEGVSATNLYEGRKGFRNTAKGWIRLYISWKLGRWFESHYDRETLKRISECVTGNDVDVVFAWWSSDVMYELLAIRKIFPKLPIVHGLFIYPNSVDRWKLHFEDALYSRVLSQLDLRLHSGRASLEYLQQKFGVLDNGRDMVFPQPLSEKYFFDTRLPLLSKQDGQPHIVYLGRTDFSRDPRKVKDDVRPILKNLTDARIHVHIGDTKSKVPQSSYLHTFQHRPMENRELANFITQFDACLVAYNIKRKCYKGRFDSGMPARFLSGLAGGIPIVIPKGTMRTCEEFIERRGIGFGFNGGTELAEKLKTVEIMRPLQHRAQAMAHQLTFEKNIDSLSWKIAEWVHPDSRFPKGVE